MATVDIPSKLSSNYSRVRTRKVAHSECALVYKIIDKKIAEQTRVKGNLARGTSMYTQGYVPCVTTRLSLPSHSRQCVPRSGYVTSLTMDKFVEL